MEFGLFFLMQRDEAWSEQAVYDAAFEQMLAAEPHGYPSVWIADTTSTTTGCARRRRSSPRSWPRAPARCGSAWA